MDAHNLLRNFRRKDDGSMAVIVFFSEDLTRVINLKNYRQLVTRANAVEG